MLRWYWYVLMLVADIALSVTIHCCIHRKWDKWIAESRRTRMAVDERDLALDECLRSGNAVVHGGYRDQ